jgi:hypothetical protein
MMILSFAFEGQAAEVKGSKRIGNLRIAHQQQNDHHASNIRGISLGLVVPATAVRPGLNHTDEH